MTTALAVAVWIAEHASGWWLLIPVPGVACWAWRGLRATGRHRRPGSGPPAESTAPRVDTDTLTIRLPGPDVQAGD